MAYSVLPPEALAIDNFPQSEEIVHLATSVEVISAAPTPPETLAPEDSSSTQPEFARRGVPRQATLVDTKLRSNVILDAERGRRGDAGRDSSVSPCLGVHVSGCQIPRLNATSYDSLAGEGAATPEVLPVPILQLSSPESVPPRFQQDDAGTRGHGDAQRNVSQAPCPDGSVQGTDSPSSTSCPISVGVQSLSEISARLPISPSPRLFLEPSTSEPLPISQSLDSSADRVTVQKIEVIGSTVFDSDELDSIIKPFEGRSLTLEERRSVADAITQLYLDQGYITSRALLENAETTDGVLKVRIIEGGLAEIKIEGTRRLNPSYIRSRIELGAGTPLNTAKLEDQLRLLRADPLLENIEASLQASGQVGQSNLVVRVQEADPFEANFSIDNYSPPSVGSERLGMGLRYRNLTGIGDELAGSYYRSTTGGADVFDFSYRVPLNAMNGTLQLRAAPNRNEITQSPFSELDIRGKSQLYELSYRQPLIRTPREEFALSVGFGFQEGQTFLFNELPTPFGIGPDEDGVSRTSVVKLSQDYLKRDPGGAWSLRSQFSIGTGLFDATTNESPIPDGQFFSWLGQVQRVQRLGDDHLLIVQADLQLTPDSLLPSQQFVIGGGQSVRGYRQNVRSGDNGFRFSIEDRITVGRDEAGAPTIQLAPFIDVGAIWNQSDNPNKLPDQTFLVGAGLGLLWDQFAGVKGLSVRLDYGLPFINLSDRGTNAQDEGFYFSVNYSL